MTGLTYILVGSSNSSPRLRLSSGIQSVILCFFSRTFLASVNPFEWIPELLTPTIVSLLFTLSPRTSLFFEQIPAAMPTRSIDVPFCPSERRSGTTAVCSPTLPFRALKLLASFLERIPWASRILSTSTPAFAYVIWLDWLLELRRGILEPGPCPLELVSCQAFICYNVPFADFPN